jgi:amino acid transporter
MLNKIHIIITLFATSVVIGFGLIFEKEISTLVIMAVITIISYYILGSIIQFFLFKHVIKNDELAEDGNNDDNDGEEGSADIEEDLLFDDSLDI